MYQRRSVGLFMLSVRGCAPIARVAAGGPVSIRQGEAHSTFAGQLRAIVVVAAILSVATGLLPGKAAAANGTTVIASDGTSLAIPGETVYVTSSNSNAAFCDLVFVDSHGTSTGSETCSPASPSLLKGSLVVPLTAAYDVATVYVCQLARCSGSASVALVQGAARGTVTIERPVAVPNVVGMMGDAAVTAVTAVGLAAQPSGPLTGTVTAQSPAAGVGVKPRSTVRISPAVLVPVPDLHGLTATGAKQKLSVAHLRLHGVLTAPGKVIDQNPLPNQFAPENSEVTVTLLAPASTPSSPQSPATVAPSPSSVTSPGPVITQSSKITVPTFTGLRNDAAVGLAGSHGLKTRWHGAGHGSVKSQSIAPGTLVDPGTEIVLTSSDTVSVSLTVVLLGLIGLAAAGTVGGRPVRWIRRVHARRVRRWFSTHVDMTITTGGRTELRPDNVAARGWPPVEMSWSSLRSYSLHGGAK
jgi:beta-lactam-binding protein with PASTA domain